MSSSATTREKRSSRSTPIRRGSTGKSRTTRSGFSIPSADRRNLPIRDGASVHPPRPRLGLWRILSAMAEEHGDRGSHHGVPVALAERLRGAGHRLHSAEVSRPRHRVRRRSPAADSVWLLRLLQPLEDASLARPELADSARGRAARERKGRRHPPCGWPASPLHAGGVAFPVHKPAKSVPTDSVPRHPYCRADGMKRKEPPGSSPRQPIMPRHATPSEPPTSA